MIDFREKYGQEAFEMLLVIGGMEACVERGTLRRVGDTPENPTAKAVFLKHERDGSFPKEEEAFRLMAFFRSQGYVYETVEDPEKILAEKYGALGFSPPKQWNPTDGFFAENFNGRNPKDRPRPA